MDFHYFTEMPYPYFPEDYYKRYGPMRVTFPNTIFDPEKGKDLYQSYLEEYEYAAEVGFDGLMLNEHHSNAGCLDPAPNVIAAYLIRQVREAKIVILGNILPMADNPIRIAEEIAMLDILSGGRQVISGFVRGSGPDTWVSGQNPAFNRERFVEAHDLIIKAWTEPGPFQWEGKHYKFRYVNPWPQPLQKPHPPVWTAGVLSPETIRWAAEHGYTYSTLLTPMETTAKAFALYHTHAAEAGRTSGPENLGYLLMCYVAETDAKAQEEGRELTWYVNEGVRMPPQMASPPGYDGGFKRLAAGSVAQKPIYDHSYEELQTAGIVVVGSPDTVTGRLHEIHQHAPFKHLIIMGQAGSMPHHHVMNSLRLIGQEVIPALKEL